MRRNPHTGSSLGGLIRDKEWLQSLLEEAGLHWSFWWWLARISWSHPGKDVIPAGGLEFPSPSPPPPRHFRETSGQKFGVWGRIAPQETPGPCVHCAGAKRTHSTPDMQLFKDSKIAKRVRDGHILRKKKKDLLSHSMLSQLIWLLTCSFPHEKDETLSLVKKTYWTV